MNRSNGLISTKNKYKFERVVRLLGTPALEKLAASHVAVVGLGGVGSYAVEGLVRSGVGHFTLIDFDLVCITNFNRQLHAVEGSVAKSKADLMGQRVKAINPECSVEVINAFYNHENSEAILGRGFDLVIDCIDNVTAKMHLLTSCVRRGIPVITSLGSAAKLDPTQVQIAPLDKTKNDPLGRAVRKYLRLKHNMTKEEMASITAVYSEEETILPLKEESANFSCGVDCVCPGGDDKPHSCDARNIVHGSAVYVTSVFGMAAASYGVKILTQVKTD